MEALAIALLGIRTAICLISCGIYVQKGKVSLALTSLLLEIPINGIILAALLS